LELFQLKRGDSPLVVSFPHVGTYLPPELSERMSPQALVLPDTDWHLPLLYDGAAGLGATTLVATHSRYVVDLNRPPDGVNLYPGQKTTGLVPVDTFAEEPIYLSGQLPSERDVQERVERYWRPYHEALRDELKRVRERHGYALLWDAHSIISRAPRLFEGQLPDLNLGTAGGRSCGAGLGESLLELARSHPRYSAVLNGRFTGGHITRSFGDPAAGVHAVQLEMSTIIYMDEQPPYVLDESRAAQLRPLLRAFLSRMLEWGAQSGRARGEGV
jgi:N-formylglutamate deformylase